MMRGDLGDVPTLACLNKPQKRALILRDELRYFEPAHLDNFLSGITTDEPPTYKNVNGAVCPPLSQVTIKDEAARFDLGNVQFPEEGGATYRAFLTVEDERFEMRTEEALPRDDADLASVPIHRFVAENMFPLFKTKYKAIHARMEKINEARRVAYNMLDHPSAKFEDGETLTRLTAKTKASDDSSRGTSPTPNLVLAHLTHTADGGSRKRKEITKHASNKRQRIGLETIPDTVKSETFNTIPAQVKVDLFDNIIKTAFPNFDNLIVASWNVVSVYTNLGSDFPELHKAVVDLKGALEEFEGAYGPRTKSGKTRKEATPTQQDSDARRAATPVRTPRTPVPVARTTPAVVSSQEDNDHHDDGNDHFQMPPPRTPEPRQHPSQPATLPAGPRHLTNTPPSPFQLPSSRPASPSTHIHPPPRSHSHSHSRSTTRDRSTGPRASPSTHAPPGSELMRKRQAYTASLSANSSHAGSSSEVPMRQYDGGGGGQHDREETYTDSGRNRVGKTEEEEEADRYRGGSALPHLGKSVLGARKNGGKAPVAPMLHTRRDGGR
ncbi:hypothetical protein C7974DRAFT_425982 [Boeremia exigua]|uniref:uncharacterized protein n=1 Tax=Boeremia exigua TaxID=749465 RepID=UPI001E8D927E|nr:uncharacterized protein C7974DRAFT_425982 [Boeremia exigua]KAH6622291.1 hypothetical protein C7974DRAFT_425982 [Boeremia exigua]